MQSYARAGLPVQAHPYNIRICERIAEENQRVHNEYEKKMERNSIHNTSEYIRILSAEKSETLSKFKARTEPAMTHLQSEGNLVAVAF